MTHDHPASDDNGNGMPPYVPAEGRSGSGADTAFLEMLRKRQMNVKLDDGEEGEPASKPQ